MAEPYLPIEVVGNLIHDAEALLLDGLEHPGKIYYVEEDARKTREASEKLVQAYNELAHINGRHYRYYRRIFYMARILCSLDNAEYRDYIFQAGNTPGNIQQELKAIAAVGRGIDYKAKWPVRFLINSGRLFRIVGHDYAANIPFPRRGCSASICSCCFEPVAFCDESCPHCHSDFVGPFGFEEFTEWSRLSKKARETLVNKIFRTANHGRLGTA